MCARRSERENEAPPVVAGGQRQYVPYRSAYSGYSTRNVIMEERNVYCGSFNTLIISDQCAASSTAFLRAHISFAHAVHVGIAPMFLRRADPVRQTHTTAGRLLAHVSVLFLRLQLGSHPMRMRVQ